jgi:hypothetical protein
MHKYEIKRKAGRPKGVKNKPKGVPPNLKGTVQDWDPLFSYHSPTSRVVTIMKYQDTIQKKHLEELLKEQMPEEIPKGNISKVYGKKYGRRFEFMGYKCVDCGRPFSDETLVDKHVLVCVAKQKINKSIENDEDEFMPIQRVTVKGEDYYRWGQHGTLYKNRVDAEKQAQAAHASGYRDTPTENRGRPQSAPKVKK